jgi:LPS export ABC transporter protein LptC
MVDNVRKILLVLVFGILGLSGYYFFVQGNAPVEKVVLKASDAGIDIEIENFKVVHELGEGEKWELSADLAQVDEEKDLTLLTNVELIIRQEDQQKLWVVADSGSILNGNKDIQLEGHVKMIGNSNSVAEKIGKKKPKAEK